MERLKVYWLPLSVALLFMSLFFEKEGELKSTRYNKYESIFHQKDLDNTHFDQERKNIMEVNNNYLLVKNRRMIITDLNDSVTFKKLYTGIQ